MGRAAIFPPGNDLGLVSSILKLLHPKDKPLRADDHDRGSIFPIEGADVAAVNYFENIAFLFLACTIANIIAASLEDLFL